jgi:hypothetical protein
MKFCGTSSLDEAALAKQLEGNLYIRLDDMVYFDQNRQPKDWSEWTKFEEPRGYINPKDVIVFLPMRGDPRKVVRSPEKQ